MIPRMHVLEHGMHVIEDGDPRPTVAPPVIEFCEQCGHPLPEDCIGWCARCGDSESSGDALDAFYTWGGWRRAFGDYTDEEWEEAKRTACWCSRGSL